MSAYDKVRIAAIAALQGRQIEVRQRGFSEFVMLYIACDTNNLERWSIGLQ